MLTKENFGGEEYVDRKKVHYIDSTINEVRCGDYPKITLR